MPLRIRHFYQFGEFTIDTDQKVLLRQGKPLPVTPKVFDTLLILVEKSGQIAEKDELMNRLWPETFVEEANLTFNIQQLRKSLGDNARNPLYIETVARRGYRFIANVEEALSDQSPVNGEPSVRQETADSWSRDDEIGKQSPEEKLETETETQTHPATIEKTLAAIPGSEVRAGVRKIRAVLVSALVIGLAVAGLVFWKLSNGTRSPRANDRVVREGPISQLKIEKLTATGESTTAAISPDGKFIAYTRHLQNKSSIWLRQLATNANVPIVPLTTRVVGLAFANSGEYLFYISGEPASLYRVSLVGGVPSRVVDNLGGSVLGAFSISPGDDEVAFIRHRTNSDERVEYSLVIAGVHGGNQRALLSSVYPENLGVPLWSADAGSVICSYGYSAGGGQDVCIVEVSVADGSKKELSPDRFFRISRMAWLPHKNGLIISARKTIGDNSQLWRLSYPGLEISQLTEEFSSYFDLSVAADAERAVATQAIRTSDIWVGSSHDPRSLKKITQAIDNFCWSPDGRLVCSSTASGNQDLWIMRRDGTEQRQLTVNAAVNGTPAVTPDNRHIVFMSNRTGAFQVWRMDIDGGNQMQLTDGAGKNFPAITPDGKWVLYNSTDDWHLWRVSIDGGECFRVTEYPALYPSVSPDGKIIACVGRNLLIIIPFEGGEPVKRVELGGWDFLGTRLKWTPEGAALRYAAERDGMRAIISQLVNGGAPEKLADFNEDMLFDFGYSTDGRLLAVTRGGWQHDVVLINGLNR